MNEEVTKQIHAHQRFIDSHEAKVTAYWKQQHKWNEGIDNRLGDHSDRLRIIEGRLMLIAGGSGAGGAVIGSFVKDAVASVIGG